MQKEIFENINTFNQTIFNASKEFFDITVRVNEKLLENQVKLTSSYMENGVKQMELVRDFKDPKAYMAAQSEIVKQSADLALTANKEAMNIVTGTREELKTWFEKGIEQAKNTAASVSAVKKASK